MISTNRKGFKVHKKQMMMMLNSLLFLKQVWRTIITEKWQYKLHSIFPKGLFRTLPPIMSCTWPMSIVVMVKLSDFFFAGISPSFNCSLCYCYSSDAHFDTQYPVEPSCDARRIRAYGSDRFALRVCRVNRIWRPFGPPSARLCRAFIKIQGAYPESNGSKKWIFQSLLCSWKLISLM